MDNELVMIICIAILIGIITFCLIAVYHSERERRMALERELNAKADFMSKISYDIRTPMNAIIGTAALGLEEVDDPEKMKQNAGAAQNERQKGHILPVDAFDFDEEETATDEPGKKEAAEQEKKHLDDWEKTEE